MILWLILTAMSALIATYAVLPFYARSLAAIQRPRRWAFFAISSRR